MSIVVTVHPRCDVCQKTFAELGDTSVRKVAEVIAAAGWQAWRGKHCCPDCLRSPERKLALEVARYFFRPRRSPSVIVARTGE